MFRMNKIGCKHALKLWPVLLLSALAFGQAGEKPKIICDHAAPPRGMHYVCKSQCDCHLEGKLKNDEDGIAPANQPSAENQPSTCQTVPTFIFAPPYPRVAQLNRIAGTVYIQLEIGDRGSVSNAS